jgi:hypothetical protein
MISNFEAEMARAVMEERVAAAERFRRQKEARRAAARSDRPPRRSKPVGRVLARRLLRHS